MDCNNFVSLIWQENREPHGVLTDRFVQRFDRYVNWSDLSKNYGLNMPLDLIRVYQHRLIWFTLLTSRLFSEDFLREMVNNFDVDCWSALSIHQKLSEAFIHDFASKVDWNAIVEHQNVSKAFLDKHYEFYTEEGCRIITSGASRSV